MNYFLQFFRPVTQAVCAALLFLVLPITTWAAKTEKNLGDMSIDELMDETITSVSKREQRLEDAASAISVVTNEDLRRSGATNVWDSLRMVPGMQVGSISAVAPAVSTRGFNNIYANKLLVMIDGRPVYTPLFGGVIWFLQQPMLDDVNRIEVIKGPGASIWGANAVNGVINILTNNARDTQGSLIYAGGGDFHRLMAGVRQGGQVGEKTYYRVFASRQLEGAFPNPEGKVRSDGDWQTLHGGFRVDHFADETTTLTLQGDLTEVDYDEGHSKSWNANVLSRWSRNNGAGSNMEVQAYYDHSSNASISAVGFVIDTFDLTFQHALNLGEYHSLIWGAGARFIHDDLTQLNPTAFILRERTSDENLFSAFVQDEFKVVPDKVTLTAGVKLERNDFTGWEVQPSVRALFRPAEHHTIWTAVSRAIRSPGESEGRNLFVIPLGPPFELPAAGVVLPQAVGNPNIRSEVLWAYEIGYRVQPTRSVSVDLAAYYNHYDGIVGLGTPAFVPGIPFSTLEFPLQNLVISKTWGAEASLAIVVARWWRLNAGYSSFACKIHGPGTFPAREVAMDAKHQATLRSSWDLGRRASLDVQFRHVSRVQTVPAYTTADVRLAFRPNEQYEIALVGQNILDRQHPEHPQDASSDSLADAEVPRSFHGKITWRF